MKIKLHTHGHSIHPFYADSVHLVFYHKIRSSMWRCIRDPLNVVSQFCKSQLVCDDKFLFTWEHASQELKLSQLSFGFL